MWEQVQKAMYDASIGQFRGIKPYKARNFRVFVVKVFTCARKYCQEDKDENIPLHIQDLNAIAIVYETVCKQADAAFEKKKQDEVQKKERQAAIEKQLNILPSPPSSPALEDTSALNMLSAVSENVMNANELNSADNQIITPPTDKEVVIEMTNEEEEAPAKGTKKRKNSSLVQGGDPTKPSSVKFRSHDTINLIDELIASSREFSSQVQAAVFSGNS